MEAFNFEILLTFNEFNVIQIKPPTSFSQLVTIALEKFDILDCHLAYLSTEDKEIPISAEGDYFNMFEFVTNNELKELRVIVESEKPKTKKKKAGIRKNSRAVKPLIQTNFDDDCNNDYYDAYNVRDMRNLKLNESNGLSTKTSYSVKETLRIQYIKQKKEMQREEQNEKQNKKQVKNEDKINDDDANFGLKNKKGKAKKGKKKGSFNEV